MNEKSKYCEVCKGVTNEGLICLTHHKEEISRLRAEKKRWIRRIKKMVTHHEMTDSDGESLLEIVYLTKEQWRKLIKEGD